MQNIPTIMIIVETVSSSYKREILGYEFSVIIHVIGINAYLVHQIKTMFCYNRTILVRLSSLLVLLSSLYNIISRCTRVVEIQEEELANECTFSTLTGNFLSNTTELNSNEACPVVSYT